MRKTLGVIGVIALIAIMVVPALAFGPDRGKGRHKAGWWNQDREGCPFYSGAVSENSRGLTDEQRSELKALYQKFYDNTAQTRNEIRAKQGELRTVWNNSNTDEEKLRTLQKEISDLKSRMNEERIEYRLQARRIDSTGSFCPGYGPGKGAGWKGTNGQGSRWN